jgi:hypothetical protein
VGNIVLLILLVGKLVFVVRVLESRLGWKFGTDTLFKQTQRGIEVGRIRCFLVGLDREIEVGKIRCFLAGLGTMDTFAFLLEVELQIVVGRELVVVSFGHCWICKKCM